MEEKSYLKDIEKLIAKAIPLVENHAFPLDPNLLPQKESDKPKESNRRFQPNRSKEKDKERKANSDRRWKKKILIVFNPIFKDIQHK